MTQVAGGLWYPRRRAGQAVKSQMGLAPTKAMQIMTQADLDRRADKAVIAFPEAGWCYIIEDTRQLKEVILKLQTVYKHLIARGQGRIVNLNNSRTDWNE